MSWTDPEFYPVGKEPIIFYSGREKRMEHAPRKVQDYYSGKLPVLQKKSFFRTLTGNTKNRLMLSTILLLCVLIALFSRL
jgi:hypothetical protein